MHNNSFNEECEYILKEAESVYNKWLQENKDQKTQQCCVSYPSPYRPPQPNWGKKGSCPSLPVPILPSKYNIIPNAQCPRCKQRDQYFQSKSVVEGCRMNGDGYGRNFQICPLCGWVCMSEYDEAD